MVIKVKTIVFYVYELSFCMQIYGIMQRYLHLCQYVSKSKKLNSYINGYQAVFTTYGLLTADRCMSDL